MAVGTDKNHETLDYLTLYFHETLIHNGSDLNPGPPIYSVQCKYIYIWGLRLSRVNVEAGSSFRSLKLGLFQEAAFFLIS